MTHYERLTLEIAYHDDGHGASVTVDSGYRRVVQVSGAFVVPSDADVAAVVSRAVERYLLESRRP
jgi:hypothetical protein